MINKDILRSIIIGTAVGDALGVPVEFTPREILKKNPVVAMRGYGVHNQPMGTWSDDTSLCLCLVDSLTSGKYDLTDIARKFVSWVDDGLWTAHGEVFDIGNATRQAIMRLKRGVNPIDAGGNEGTDNGNGSLMRILPLLPFIYDLPFDERMQRICEVSSLTHRHSRSILACQILVEFARNLCTMSMENAFAQMQETFCNQPSDSSFDRILQLSFEQFCQLSEYEIQSTGYVIHTLEASLWSLFNTKSYREAVLKAVNLGSDTDTTGAVTGGLAGIVYGYDGIPKEWVEVLARREEIMEMIKG